MVFSKILKILQLPGDYNEAALESLGDATIKLHPDNPSMLKPGDIATFSYEGGFMSSRRFLVVSTKTHPSGKFTSSKGNPLICAYDLTSKENVPGLVMIFNSFYKKRRSTYDRLTKTMNSVFGKNNFKTFNTRKMSSVFRIEVPPKPVKSKGNNK